MVDDRLSTPAYHDVGASTIHCAVSTASPIVIVVNAGAVKKDGETV